MGLMTKYVVLVTMVTVMSLVTCELCSTGALKPNKLCTDQCLSNTTCHCEAMAGTEVEHCKQYCSYFTGVCSSMSCRGGVSCKQYCGKATCNMTCSENSDFCHQNCTTDGKCDVIKCSSNKCYQKCANCTMICTKEVEECNQVCLAGVCTMKCSAQNCVNDCSNATNNTECEVDISGKVIPSEGQTTQYSIILLMLTFAILALA